MIISVARPEPAPDGGAQLVREWDPETEPKGDVVLVHGIGEHSGRYAQVGSWLTEGGYRVRSFDLLGFGASSGPRGDIARWSLYLDQVEGHLRAMRTEGRPLVLMGHSMGGLIAAEYAVSERPQPDLLVLSSPALTGGASWQRTIAPFIGRAFPTLSLPTAVKGSHLSRDPAVGEAYTSDPLNLFKVTTRLGANIFASQDRVIPLLSRISIPTFVIHGDDDPIVPPEASQLLLGLPGVERRLYPDLRHECLNEPEGRQVTTDILSWLDEHSSQKEPSS
ncbi:MAG TPA: alpha/beta hydrolase [Acidimicrobiia bacterium]|nr:alpha/beta hydrolase [Acidimicrobiia bacterium]